MVDLWRGTFKNILECFKMSFYEKNYKMTMIFHLYISSLNCAGTMSFDRWFFGSVQRSSAACMGIIVIRPHFFHDGHAWSGKIPNQDRIACMHGLLNWRDSANSLDSILSILNYRIPRFRFFQSRFEFDFFCLYLFSLQNRPILSQQKQFVPSRTTQIHHDGQFTYLRTLHHCSFYDNRSQSCLHITEPCQVHAGWVATSWRQPCTYMLYISYISRWNVSLQTSI